MCDLAAPLLILFDDESLVYSCFVKLMEKITFQKGNLMDIRLGNLRSLTQVRHVENQEQPSIKTYSLLHEQSRILGHQYLTCRCAKV